jgi:hypothetical protein
MIIQDRNLNNYLAVSNAKQKKWMLPKSCVVNDKAPCYMYLARNIWALLKSPEQKRIILAPTILIDTIYQDIQEYQRKYQPRQKEKQVVKKILATCKAYHKKLFQLAPHLQDLILDNMDGFEECIKQNKFYMWNSIFNLYATINEINDNQKRKLVDLLTMTAFANWSVSFANLIREAEADHELVAIQHLLHSTPDIILGNADFTLNGISEHNMQVYERSSNLFGKALLNYIGNINLEQ